MENLNVERVNCLSSAFELPMALFVVGAIVLTWYVARQNSFGLKDALLAAVGLKKFPRTWKINLFHMAVLILPMVFFLFLSVDCHRL